MSTPTEDELVECHRVYLETGQSVRETARRIGVARSTVRTRLDLFSKKTGINWQKPIAGGEIRGMQSIVYALPKKGQVHRYIITSMQNNTKIHKKLWENLLAFAAYHDAKVLVSQFSYNKASYGPKSVKRDKAPTYDDRRNLWFDPKIEEQYVCNDRIELAPTLVFCGEQNTIPTAVRPLSGFETYPGGSISAIFPHTTFALDSIATMKGQDVKFNYATGCVSLRNYVQKKAGLRAEFSHSYGALIVEVNHEGDWWVRQLNAKEDGSFYDFDIRVADGKITRSHPVEAVTWGDIHVAVLDPAVAALNWGKGGILDTLKPKYQFFHDILDFHARNHHARGNCHANYERWLMQNDDVRKELQTVVDFLNTTAYRDWSKSVVVPSNHDAALERWLREADFKSDPLNATIYLECQLLKYKATGDENFMLLEAISRQLGVSKKIRFLRDDESFMICGRDGIQCGLHGHLGSNGAKGNPLGLSRLGSRANTGHTHTAQIIHGLYVAGTCSKLKLEYNKGPSSWSWSHVITYANSKRTIITLRNGKWKA